MRPAASDPVQTCIQPLPSARKYVAVRLLTGETLFFVVEAKAKVRDLLSAVVRNLGTLGMVSYDLFGLAFLLDGEYLFLEPETKLAKYAPKIWKASHGSGLDAHGNPLLTFHFRVQYYVDNPLFFRDRVTRLHFYLQLRENVVHYSQSCGEETLLLLAALALQADVGDFSEEKHRGQYFDLNCYLPGWIIERLGESYLLQQIAGFHRNQRGVTQASAQLSYIKEASHGECYHSLHIYRLMHTKKADQPRDRGVYIARTPVTSPETTVQPTTSVWLGIATRGVDIYETSENSLKTLRAGLLWHSIKNLSFERRKFELRAESENKKFTYYASSDVKCKHLLYLCQATHQFSMKIAEDVRNAKDSPANLAWAAENGLPHPSDATLASIQTLGISELTLSSLVDQRVSTTSTSSTTSGIVSDRVLSLDSEDEGRDTVLGQLELRDLTSPRNDGKQSTSPVAQSCDFVDGRTVGVTGKTPDWSGDVTDGPIRSDNVEESEYWYACDDDASDAGSTSEHCTGAMCECRRVRASSPDLTHPHVCTLSEDTLRAHSPSGHNKVPSGISESSSLVVSVGNTQDSDCHSVFHSYLSSEDSTKAQKFFLDEPQCVSSEQSTLTQKDSKDLSVIINNALINQRTSPVQSGTLPRTCHSQNGTLSRKDKESPLGLDLTVQSAVPSGGTYPRRSTISSTFDTDSDYVEFSPADANQLFTSYEPCQHRTLTPKPESPRKKQEEKEKHTAMVFGSHTVPRNVAMATITPVPLATKGGMVPKTSEASEKTPIEAQARFIRSRPTITVQQAHEFVPTTTAPSFAQPVRCVFAIPPPAYPGTQFTPIHPSKKVAPVQFVAQPKVSESLPNLLETNPDMLPFIARLKPGYDEKQPVIGANNYLDVRASNTLSRPQKEKDKIQEEQYLLGIPPPPQYPGHALGATYKHQLNQSQIEQFKAQLYSDVDYVIYPLKDPALSEQEYMDFKEATSVGAQEYILPETLPPPPPYRPAIYRSNPNVALQNSGEIYSYSSNHSLTSSNYSSNYSSSNYFSNYSSNYSANQLPIAYVPYPRLSSKYVSTQSLASSHSSNPSAYSTSTHSASLAGSYEPIGEARRAALRARTGLIHRVHSEDSILSCDTNDAPFVVPPPPPYRKSSASSNQASLPQLVPPPEGYKQHHFSISTLPNQRSSMIVQKVQPVPALPTTKQGDARLPHRTCTLPPQQSQPKPDADPRLHSSALDFKTIIEQTKTKDLPLLNALCSDPSLQFARKELLGIASKSSPGLVGDLEGTKKSVCDIRRNCETLPKTNASAKTDTLPKSSIQNQPLPPIPCQSRPSKPVAVPKQPTPSSTKTSDKPFDPATTPLPPLPVEATVEPQNFSKQLFAKAVNRHSYAVSPGKTRPPTTGLYAISDLSKPVAAMPKKSAPLCHLHHQLSLERAALSSQKPK